LWFNSLPSIDWVTSVNATAGFTSSHLLLEERALMLQVFEIIDAIEIGSIAKDFGIQRTLPIAVEVRIGDWVVYHANLPGSEPENDHWISRKARVVKLKHHSTLYERVRSEERSEDWFAVNKVDEEEYAIHGGGLPLITKSHGFVGTLLISGLPQVDDHLLGVEVITEYLARKGELH
jgi:uncharacterized protein (UPF0303 family)